MLPQWLGKEPIVPDRPNFDLEHWTPVSITSFSHDPQFQLCKLNFEAYTEEGPHKLPMFKDLVSASKCKGKNSKTMRMSEIKKEMKMEETSGKPRSTMIPPTGFIFHESRVGSTLVANLLGADPFNMVFSEAAAPASVLLHCHGCSHEDKINRFRDTILAMGRSPTHKRVFFKFQSLTTTQIKIALEAFPDTPWVFVYRNPVQTMMSHLAPKKGKGGWTAKCVTSAKSFTTGKVQSSLEKFGLTIRKAPAEAVCAAHLNALCEYALEAFDEFKHSGRGLLLDYQYLPGAVTNIVLPHFGMTHRLHKSYFKKLVVESVQYSKSSVRNKKRGKFGFFGGDSEDKEKRATPSIEEWAEKILKPSYIKMEQISLLQMQQVYGRDLSEVSKIPGAEEALLEKSDDSFFVPPTYAYEPFLNTHNSTPYEVNFIESSKMK